MKTQNAWRTFPIFVSSTFKDMQAERDYLNRFVVPRLEKEFAHHCVDFKVIDLRWGVVTSNIPESEREAKVLKICLESISNSRPFFIALLGHRYGWIPDENHWRSIYKSLNKEERSLVSNTVGKSVTELEILYGALGNPDEILSRSLFFFRTDDSYKGMSNEVLPMYRDPKYSEDEKKLLALKDKIRTVCKEHNLENSIHEYELTWNGQKFDGLKEWGDQVFENLCREIKEEILITEDDVPKEWYEKEQVTLNRFINYQLQRFRGREELLNKCDLFLSHNNKLKIITAFSGAGKSAFMCKLYSLLKVKENPSQIILFHSAGISHYAQETERMLQIWSKILCEEYGIDEYLEEKESGQKKSFQDRVKEQFEELLNSAKNKGFKVIMLIDALDRFNQDTMSKYLQWLPEGFSVLCTATPGQEEPVLKMHPQAIIEKMPLFSQNEARNMLVQICEDSGKELYGEVLDILLNKHDGNYYAYMSPLWLSLVGNILFGLDADDFEEIRNKNITGDEAKILAFLCELAESFPSDPQDLFKNLLYRASKDFGEELTMKSLTYIALSRNGLREKDLSTLLGSKWDELMFSSLCRWFKFLVIESADRLWTFAHIKLTETLIGHDKIQDKARHREITDYLLALPEDDIIRAKEVFYHLIEADYKEKVAPAYIDFTDDTRKFAEDTLWVYYNKDKSILNYMCDCISYVSSSNEDSILYAGRLIVDFGPRISFGNPEGFVNTARQMFNSITYKGCDIKLTRWLGVISFRVSTVCAEIKDYENLKFFAEIQVYCYKILAENFKNDPDAEVYRNNLAMAFHKLGEYYSSQGHKELATEYFNRMTQFEDGDTDPLVNKEPLIRKALSYLAKAQAALQERDFEEAEQYMLQSYREMEELYDLDRSDARILKGFISSIGQLTLFYQRTGRTEQAIPLIEKGAELNEYLYQEDPQVNVILGIAMFYQQLIKYYGDEDNHEKAAYYFKKMDKAVTLAQRNYPDEEMVGRFVNFRDQMAEYFEEEEDDEDTYDEEPEMEKSQSESLNQEIDEFINSSVAVKLRLLNDSIQQTEENITNSIDISNMDSVLAASRKREELESVLKRGRRRQIRKHSDLYKIMSEEEVDDSRKMEVMMIMLSNKIPNNDIPDEKRPPLSQDELNAIIRGIEENPDEADAEKLAHYYFYNDEYYKMSRELYETFYFRYAKKDIELSNELKELHGSLNILNEYFEDIKKEFIENDFYPYLSASTFKEVSIYAMQMWLYIRKKYPKELKMTTITNEDEILDYIEESDDEDLQVQIAGIVTVLMHLQGYLIDQEELIMAYIQAQFSRKSEDEKVIGDMFYNGTDYIPPHKEYAMLWYGGH